MRTRLTKLGAALTAVVALAVGGSALAGAGTLGPSNPPAAAVDVQQGNQTAPDTGAQASEPVSALASSESAPEPVESASESAATSDGPGGHADEPANATADYQVEGEQ